MLRQKMSDTKGDACIEECGESGELEQRYKALADQLRALHREGPASARTPAPNWIASPMIYPAASKISPMGRSGSRGTKPFIGQRKPWPALPFLRQAPRARKSS
jgi:hypothetical protein